MTLPLHQLLGWLEEHISYERLGPGDSFDPTHDPATRLRDMVTLLTTIGDPHRLFPAVHLTGTNGKTSTARMVTALMLAQGLSTGTYTSPHLSRLNERIEINGEPISDDELADALQVIKLSESILGNVSPSYFEITTAAAFRAFADSASDVGVVEVGVGGMWDATNVLDAVVTVVTNVALDHQAYLGDTREQIATQKAGIVAPGSTLIVGENDPMLLPIFEQREPKLIVVAGRDFDVEGNRLAVGGRLVDIKTPTTRYDEVYINLHGAHQGINAATALTAVEAFFEQPLGDDVVREAFESVRSPGRMEVVRRQPLVLLDGAHNTAGARVLSSAVDEAFGESDRILVVGLLRPHDPVEMLEALASRRVRMLVACEPDWPRAVPTDEIVRAARSMGIPVVGVTEVSRAVDEAMAAAGDDDLVVVTGSLYVVGEARAALVG